VGFDGKSPTKSNTKIYLTFYLIVFVSHLHGSNYHEIPTMKQPLIFSVLLLSLLAWSPVFSADFQKSLNAYKKGDFATALREWKPLADKGDATAQSNLGFMYDTGQGVPQNYKTAFKWYKLAAEQGVSNAQYKLGQMYYQGQGVPQDNKTAVKWWKLAAEQGIANAQYKLGQMYYQGQGVPQNYKTAFKWYKLAAEHGVSNAQHKLGQMYGFGRGVLKDNVYAYMWWDIAASQGDRDARKNRDFVEKKMSPTQFESAQNLSSECVKKNYKEC
jgi:hypothetical protein